MLPAFQTPVWQALASHSDVIALPMLSILLLPAAFAFSVKGTTVTAGICYIMTKQLLAAIYGGVLMGELEAIGLIKKRFAETGNPAQIPIAKGRGTFSARLANDLSSFLRR